jgi:hypothetical protein
LFEDTEKPQKTLWMVYSWMRFKPTHSEHAYKMKMAMIALMMEAARTSETLVNFYQTTRLYNPEDSHLRTHRRENLKSYCRRIR